VASNLAVGTYSANLVWSNLTDGTWQSRTFTLAVATADSPIAASGYNAGLIVPANATGGNTATYITATFGGFGFYSSGLDADNYSGGNSSPEGLPATGSFISLLDSVTTFQLGPYGQSTNVLLLSPNQGFASSGNLVLASPRAYSSLSILASSGYGYSGSAGQGTFVLHFTNGSASAPITYNAQDWYSPGTDVAITHFGRIYVGNYGIFYTDNPSGSDPNLYHTKVNLASLGLATQAISSITFTMPTDSDNKNEYTGIFAISGTAAVTVTPVAPMLGAKNQGHGTILLSWSAQAGLSYQVQYLTNLSSTNWQNLGSSLTASNSSLTTSDGITNSDRFYRVQVVP
jgi:hypothetical protein